MPDGRERVEELLALAARLGFEIRDVSLYDRALTHASRQSEGEVAGYDYESLEFLGDAVLGLAIAHDLFQRLPDQRPGDYSRMRAALVNRKIVARVGSVLEIAPHIRLGKGEELSGGRERVALLADCLEALIGAIYLDHGYETARDFVVRVFDDEVSSTATNSSAYSDYKSRLQNYCQARRLALPRFVLVRSEGPDHLKEFEVEVYLRDASRGRGTGSTIKEAEQQAAREALHAEGEEG